MPTKKGFTLIELLTVISIIALLATIVLTAVSNARIKANNAKIKDQMAQIRNAALLYFDTNETYGSIGTDCINTELLVGTVFADSLVAPLITAANYPSGTQLSCSANDQIYAVSATLDIPGQLDQWWCVDSTGVALQREGYADSLCNS